MKPGRLVALLGVVALTATGLVAHAQAFQAKPKLIVLVVIDQFRGDYLTRDHAKFAQNGFRLFTDRGAWFTDCYYNYANTKTAPGHATLGTGAYTDGHGIETNEFWDASRSYDHRVSSVEDEHYQLVDVPESSIPANQPGAPETAAKFLVGSSPLNLRATTFGDELRLATQGRAKVFGVSLKDRASILPAGQSANGAFWIDQDSGQFTTSTYYMEHLPEWAKAFNAGPARGEAEAAAMVPGTTQFYELVGRTPAANRYELQFAEALIDGEKLGQNEVTDYLVVSLSPNDIQGHQFGPDSDSEEKMILSLDKDLGDFFDWLDKKVGLDNTWIALSADHGVAPVPTEAAELGIHSATVDMKQLFLTLDQKLAARFAGGKKTEFFLSGADLPYLTLDQRAFKALNVTEQAAEEAVVDLLPDAIREQAPKAESYPVTTRMAPAAELAYAYTRVQMLKGQLPPSERGTLLAHSVADHGNWYVLMELGSYQMGRLGGGTTHFAPYNYDRHVPLAFYGAPFRAGEYHERVEPVDLAATLASLAGVNQPSAAVGRILTESLKAGVHGLER